MTEEIYHQATTQFPSFVSTTGENNLGQETASHQGSASSTIASVDITTKQSENPSPPEPPHTDTSTASNGILHDSPPSGRPRCGEVRLPLINKTLTVEEVEETVEKIITHLSVNKEVLSSYKRRKISAPDDRVSSTTMGMGGIIFIGAVLGLVFISDISKLLYDFRLAFGNIKKPTK